MDSRRIRVPSHVTPVVDLPEYFGEYTKDVNTIVLKNKKKMSASLMEATGLTPEEYDLMTAKFSASNFSWKSFQNKKMPVPVKGFLPDFNLYDIPQDTKLYSLKALKNFSKYKRRHRLVKYRAQISCDTPETTIDEGKGKKQIKEYSDYLINVRVYNPMTYWAFSANRRTDQLTVSQEFLVYSEQDLSSLRDRILCREDYCSPEGDVSLNPFLPTKIYNHHVYRSSMFFINDKFYIDGRNPGNVDYSVEVKEWAERKKLPYNVTEKMESTRFKSIKFRLGYPYLFMHLGNCEHLVIFTDARLVGPYDIHAATAYPLMKSFSSLRGKRCSACGKKIPKFIVTGMPTLPRKKSYMCGICLFRYCYTSDGKKVSNFSVYKYVDKVALF